MLDNAIFGEAAGKGVFDFGGDVVKVDVEFLAVVFIEFVIAVAICLIVF